MSFPSLTLFQLREAVGGSDGERRILHSAPPFKLFNITQKLANLVRQNYVTFSKIYLKTFIQKNLFMKKTYH